MLAAGPLACRVLSALHCPKARARARARVRARVRANSPPEYPNDWIAPLSLTLLRHSLASLSLASLASLSLSLTDLTLTHLDCLTHLDWGGPSSLDGTEPCTDLTGSSSSSS